MVPRMQALNSNLDPCSGARRVLRQVGCVSKKTNLQISCANIDQALLIVTRVLPIRMGHDKFRLGILGNRCSQKPQTYCEVCCIAGFAELLKAMRDQRGGMITPASSHSVPPLML